MKLIKIIVVNMIFVFTVGQASAQPAGLGSLFGLVSSLGDATSVIPVLDLSPLLSLDEGIPVVERLPVVTSLPVISEFIGDGRGPDPITLIGEVLGLEQLPLELLFDGTIPF